MVLSASRARLAQLVDRYVARATPALFAEHGITLTPLAASRVPDRNYSIAGIVGFVGLASGTLLLGTTPSLVLACHPLKDHGAILPERLILDWIAELANQLMGRLEVRLARHAVSLRFSSPISLAGDRMRHVMANGTTCRAAFAWGNETVSVWIDAELAGDVIDDVDAFHDDDEAPGHEGQVILF